MKELYAKQLGTALEHQSDAEALSHLSSIVRSLLQTLALSAMEIASRATPTLDGELDLKPFLDRFSQPSDGLPIEVLDTLVPRIRSLVFRAYMNGWYEKEGDERPLVESLNEWVQFRNKRPGHGVLDAPTTAIWATRSAELVQKTLDLLGDALPRLGTSGLTCNVGDLVIPLSVPLVVDGTATVISKVVARNGVWKVQAQLLSWTDAREVTIDLSSNNIFARDHQPSDKFRWLDVPSGPASKLVLCNIPGRQTSTFVGRKKELDKLSEWLQDVVDSRTCLVYGDGGFGKTTLVLEFFNSLLEDGVDSTETFLPAIISFYTAKKTKWTEEGLVHFKGISDAMEDSVRELLYCLHPVLGKEWYGVDGRALIDKAATELANEGFTRDDVLLIIDNTETLATSVADAEALADFISRVAKRIGRVIITSRRRELLSAVPVAVSQLSESEALSLMQKLGNEYGARSITQASEPKLRRACGLLMHKPLLVDTLVRYIARSSAGIQDGLDQILKKTNDELLEFLYEDAWQRMSRLVQDVFLVLVSLAAPLDSKSVGDACREVGVLHSEFQAGLAETYFATIVDHGDHYDLEIVELAKEFFRQKKRRFPNQDAERFENIAFKIDKLAAERYEIDRSYRTDRVADAYRSEYAKAAKLAIIRRDYQSANELFELAILEEPLNAALRERVASFFLRNLGKPDLALPHARASTETDARNADGWLTLGLVKYQIKDLSGGDIAIDKAKDCGKPESLCLLRKAIARYHVARQAPYARRSLDILKEAQAYLEAMLRFPSSKDFYGRKNRNEADKYVALVRSLILKINRREVLTESAPSSPKSE